MSYILVTYFKANTDVIICRRPATGSPSASHYINNNGYGTPSYLVATNPSIGISNSVVSVANGVFTWSFVRDNTLNVAGFYKIVNNAQAYLVAAYGNGKKTILFDLF